ncbi:MAG: hypothetical protein K2M12_00410 [Muribaculaceae bacterium]|nr:hypothetical protein [Muribaculaceae bacterium]
MRSILVSVVLAVVALQLTAATGARVALKRELVPFEVDELEAPVWDTDRRSTLDDHAPAYTRLAAGVYYEWAPDRCRSYALKGDTLVYRGYNAGRHERMLLDVEAPSRVADGATASGFSGAFTARGLLYDRYPTIETGTLQTSVLGSGRLVISGDSIPAILQREIIDTQKSFEGDSCSAREHTVIYRWLRRGDLHPLAMQIEADGLTPRLFAADEIGSGDSAPGTDGTEDTRSVENIMAVLESATAVRTASGVDVSFGRGADTPFDVDVYLIDTTGNIYASATISCDDTCSLPLPAVYAGQLFVTVCCAENPELRYKFFAGI